MEQIELLLSFGLFILIWLIQCLHYPTFLFTDQKRFVHFEVFHTKRISYIVIPLMMSEALCMLMIRDFVVIAIVSLIWASTFFIQVPCHNKLKHGYDEVVIRKLIRTNWIRTVLWSLKLIYLLSSFRW